MKPYGTKKKSHIQAFALFFILVLSLTGCAGSTRLMRSYIETERVLVSFSWWGNDERNRYTLNGLNLFESQNSKIDVIRSYGVWGGYERRMDVYMKSRRQTDVMQIDYPWLDRYSPDGEGFYDLSSEDIAGFLDLSNFSEQDLSFGMRGGHLNALPLAYNAPAFFYNKTVYDKYGLPLPTTWDELFDAASVMRQDGVYPIGMEDKHLLIALIAYFEQTAGKSFFDADGNIAADEDDIVRILDFYKSLVDGGVVGEMGSFDSMGFERGSFAGVQCWISQASDYCDGVQEAGSQIEIGSPITASDNNSALSGWYMKPSIMYAISNITDHPQESAMLLNFLINNEDMIRLQGVDKGVPISAKAREILEKEGLNDSFEYKVEQSLFDGSVKYETMPSAMEDPAFLEHFHLSANKYLHGTMDAKECAREILRRE